MAEQTEFNMLMLWLLICGVFRGMALSNFTLTVSEYCSLEQLPAAFGWHMIGKGLFVTCFGPLIGNKTKTHSFIDKLNQFSSILECVLFLLFQQDTFAMQPEAIQFAFIRKHFAFSYAFSHGQSNTSFRRCVWPENSIKIKRQVEMQMEMEPSQPQQRPIQQQQHPETIQNKMLDIDQQQLPISTRILKFAEDIIIIIIIFKCLFVYCVMPNMFNVHVPHSFHFFT